MKIPAPTDPLYSRRAADPSRTGNGFLAPAAGFLPWCARNPAHLVLWLVGGLLSASVYAAPVEDHGAIRSTVQHFVEQRLPADRQDRSLTVGNLDPRLRVVRCDVPLQAFLPAGSTLSGHGTVGVRCNGSHPWQLYVPVSVQVFDSILVATRSLPRGSRLEADHLRLERRDISSLNAGYLSDPDSADGLVLRRPLALGQPVTPDMVEAEQLVRRGDRVTLLARFGGMEVRMAGKALMNGAAGDRIQVRNLSSKLVVEGEITAPGIVQVNL